MSDAYCKIATNSGWTCSNTHLRVSKYSWKNFPLCVGVSGLGNTILYQCLHLIQLLIHNFTCHTNRRCFKKYFVTFKILCLPEFSETWLWGSLFPLYSLCRIPLPRYHTGVYFQTSLNLHFTNPFWITTHLRTKVRSSDYPLQLQLWVAGGSSTNCSGITSDLDWPKNQRYCSRQLRAHEQLNTSSLPAGARCSSAFGEIWRDLTWFFSAK